MSGVTALNHTSLALECEVCDLLTYSVLQASGKNASGFWKGILDVSSSFDPKL